MVRALLEHLAGMEEASISEAFEKCFDDKDDYGKRSNVEKRRIARALKLCGWERVGKFTSGNKRNQVRFVSKSV